MNLDWLEPAASAATAAGIIFAAWQLLQTKKQVVTSFEDDLAREYREICSKLPTRVFFGAELTPEELEDHIDEFYQYFDLSNSQLFFRQIGRVSAGTWRFWADGMRYNLSLKAFAAAWAHIEPRIGSSFDEFRKSARDGFRRDPRSWKRVA